MVVPLVVVGLPTAYLGAIAYADAREARHDRAVERRYERHVLPARVALTAIRIDGTTVCTDHDSAGRDACLEGERAPRALTPLVERALTAAGATDVSSRCRPAGVHDFCVVSGRMGAVAVTASVAPRPDTRSGARAVLLVSGFA